MNLRWRLRRLRNMGRGASTHPFAVAGPSAQQTVDIFKDQWITAFPDELGVDAGWVNHFDPEVDARVPWVDSILPGGLAGRSVLELGPFEAYQTWMLEQRGATVTAVEASRTAYLKCLVVKELLGIAAPFVYSDALAYLDVSQDHYDVVWASGILYHQADPLGFLERAAAKGDHLFLHTHYFDASVLDTPRGTWLGDSRPRSRASDRPPASWIPAPQTRPAAPAAPLPHPSANGPDPRPRALRRTPPPGLTRRAPAAGCG